MQAVRDSLPMEFLMHAEFRMHGIDRAFSVFARLYASQRASALRRAMNRWLTFARKARDVEQRRHLALRKLWQIGETFVLRCSRRVWNTFVSISEHCSECESVAAAVEMQRVWRGCIARSEHAARLVSALFCAMFDESHKV